MDSIVTLAAEIMNLFKVVVLLHLPAGLDPNRITEQRLLGIDYHFIKSLDLYSDPSLIGFISRTLPADHRTIT